MEPASVEQRDQVTQFAIVEGFIRAWASHDIEGCLAYCSPNVSYSDNIGDVAKTYRGVWNGKSQLERVMRAAAKNWTNLVVRPKLLKLRSEGPSLVQCQIEFVVIHKSSGEIMFGGNRFVARVEAGRITAIQVYYDAPMFWAFLRLMASNRRSSVGRARSFADSWA